MNNIQTIDFDNMDSIYMANSNITIYKNDTQITNTNDNQLSTSRAPSFLNSPTENPWKNCAPHVFLYNRYPRNFIYNVLDYDKWQHLTKDIIINHLLRESFQDIPKHKRWRDVCGYFCIHPDDKISSKELKYIYEFLLEMPSSSMPRLLRNLNMLAFQNETPKQEKRIQPSILQQTMFQLNQLPLNLKVFPEKIKETHTLNKGIANIEFPIQVPNIMDTSPMQSNTFETNPINKVCNKNTATQYNGDSILAQQRNVFKRPNDHPKLPKSARKKACPSKNLNPLNFNSPIQETSNSYGSSITKNNAIQLLNSCNLLYPSIRIPQIKGNKMKKTKLPVHYSFYNQGVSKNKLIAPKLEVQISTSVPQSKPLQTYLQGTNFEINEAGDIIFFGDQNINNTNLNNTL